MSNAIELADDKRAEIVSKLVLTGDLSTLNDVQQAQYYKMFCESLNLNPLTRPFEIMKNQKGKMILYANKDASEQLRKNNGISVTRIDSNTSDGLITITAYGCDKTGRIDASTGCVSITGLRGDALANAKMKAETKAKRRLTLSICGLGVLDETELETIPGAVKPTEVNTVTGKEEYEDVKAQRLDAPAEDGNPLAERRDLEKEIGRLAALVSEDAVKSARVELVTIHDMEKSGAIAWDDSVERVKALKASIEDMLTKKEESLF